MTIMLEDVIKLLLAVLIGGLVGAEREFRDKAAGFRTIIFICVGATLFTLFSLSSAATRTRFVSPRISLAASDSSALVRSCATAVELWV